MLSLSAILFAKDWMGITPLRSSRPEVEKLFGKGVRQYGTTFKYKYKKHNVFVSFSTGLCAQAPEAKWNVEKDVVLDIVVDPLKTLFLNEISLDLAGFEKLPGDFDLPKTYYYLNQKDGMAFDLDSSRGNGKETVNTIYYFPQSSQRNLKCQNLPDNPIPAPSLQ